MTTPDLKADLLDALDEADRFDSALTTELKDSLRARIKSATITEPPPPDPCVVECGEIRTVRPRNPDSLRIEWNGLHVCPSRTEAAALIPALQEFVREGGV